MTEAEKIQQDIEWVDALILKLLRTKDARDIRHSLAILEKRKKSLLDKLTQNIDID
jgi:hypothetical protein